MIGMIGFQEVIIVVGIIVLLFGASQIPKVAKSLGEGLKEFKKSVKEAKDMDEDDLKKDDNDKNEKAS